MHNSNHPQSAVAVTPGFYGLGIVPKILETLERIKFKVPTPIQQKAIPPAIEGKDVIGIAQTGTGKTLSFAVPMVQQLALKKGVGLVLAPTRELAIQIEESFRVISVPFGMRTACLIGGASMVEQTAALRNNPRIVIATPGRLIDHISQWNFIPDDVCMLVLDEADRMLDMGFAPQIDKILRFLPKNKQTMLFSATMPKEIMDMAAKHMKLPVCVEIAPQGTAADTVTQELFIVKREAKAKLLAKILSQYKGSVLLFTRTKIGARKVTRAVHDMGYKAAEIHSNRSLAQRKEALEGFKRGYYRVLVATDIASRGIDVTGIELVVNYDLPEDAGNYVHRIGRTGRAGHKGHAISLATPDQKSDVKDIEKLIRSTLPVASHPEFPPEQFSDNVVSDKYSRHAKHRPFSRSRSSSPEAKNRGKSFNPRGFKRQTGKH